jgi:5-formyltetrahydrofolate cyclo-ligase
MPDLTEIGQQKTLLRAAALARRDALPAADRQAAAEAIAARALPVAVAAGIIVSGYSPMKTEISPLPLLRKLADAGAGLALPAIVSRGKPLIMRAWTFAAPLTAGQWGILEPAADAAEVAPDILIVPLAAFDRRGHRIGYGAGYYDITLRGLRKMKKIIAIGIGFAAQEIDKVPATTRDERLDLVLTERETIDFRGR